MKNKLQYLVIFLSAVWLPLFGQEATIISEDTTYDGETDLTFHGLIISGGDPLLTLSNGTLVWVDYGEYEGYDGPSEVEGIHVGNGWGSGRLNVLSGSSIWSDYDTYIGFDSHSGSVLVSGVGSELGSRDIHISRNGVLNVLDGGKVFSQQGVIDGGIVTISGADSQWEISSWNTQGYLDIGGGTLAIENGASISASAGIYINSKGELYFGYYGGTGGSINTPEIVMDGGSIYFEQTDTVTIDSDIIGSGTIYQRGSGTSILTGDNEFLNIGVEGGTLVLSGGSSTVDEIRMYGGANLSITDGAFVDADYVDVSGGAITVSGEDSFLLSNVLRLENPEGELNVLDGGTVDVGSVEQMRGVITVSGEDSFLQSNVLRLESWEDGLNILDGGTVVSQELEILHYGVATISGAESRMEIQDRLDVVEGILNVHDGASLVSRDASVDGDGAVYISGEGSRWDISNNLQLQGYRGLEQIIIENGGTLVVSRIDLQRREQLRLDSGGTLEVEGLWLEESWDPIFDFGGTLILNGSSSSSLLVEEGGVLRGLATVSGNVTNKGTIHVGLNEGLDVSGDIIQAGIMNVYEGAEAQVENLYIGNDGREFLSSENAAVVHIDGGSKLTSSSAVIASNVDSPSPATLRVTGNSIWNNTGDLYIGESDQWNVLSGTGHLVVSDGGRVEVRQNVFASGGTIEVSGYDQTGKRSTAIFDSQLGTSFTAGLVEISDGGYVETRSANSQVVIRGEGAEKASEWLTRGAMNILGSSSITEGGLLRAQNMAIGSADSPGSSSSYSSDLELSGGGSLDRSKLVAQGLLSIHNGSLLITEGAEAQVARLNVMRASATGGESRSALLHISGSGDYGPSTLNVASSFLVGQNNGRLETQVVIEGGGHLYSGNDGREAVITGGIKLGVGVGPYLETNTKVRLDGGGEGVDASSYWRHNGSFRMEGGSLEVTNGAFLETGWASVGGMPSFTNVLIDGANEWNHSRWYVGYEGLRIDESSQVVVSNGGELRTVGISIDRGGSIVVVNGGTVTTPKDFERSNNINNGYALISGSNSRFEVNEGNLYVSGASQVVVSNGGELFVAGDLMVYDDNSVVGLDVVRNNVLQVGGDFHNNGLVRLTATPSLVAGTYTPIEVGGEWNDANGTYEAIGGIWNNGTHEFIVSSAQTTSSGSQTVVDLSATQRLEISGATGQVMLAFNPNAKSSGGDSNISFVGTENNVGQIDGESVLAAWDFETDLDVGTDVQLALDIGIGQNPSLLTAWYSTDGLIWTTYETEILYDGQFASFFVGGFSSYAITGVPEPATFVLLAGLGLVGVVLVRRRFRQGE